MKELSIEQKAKRYDEALESMRDWITYVPIDEVAKNYILETFPELKESEDERIRKALMQNLKERFGTKGNIGKGLDMPDVLAWLEKQGEHAKFCDSIQVGDKVTRNQDGVLVNLSQLKRVAKPAEKQGEQKPDWSEEDEAYYDTIVRKLKAVGDDSSLTPNQIDFLDKHRPKSYWKPSNEQIEALESATENCAYSEYQDCLRELMAQLKKLKG